ncbi:hypothetical protein DXG03_006053, partial [Asterophora parasitica]
MVCHTYERHVGSVKSVYDAVEKGRLDVAELVNGGKRVEALKDVFVGGWKDVLGDDDEKFEKEWKKLKAANAELSKKAYRTSTAVLWGKEKLPLKVAESKEVLLLTPAMESLNRAVDDADGVLRDGSGRVRNTAGAAYLALAEQVQVRAKTKHVVYASDSELVAPGGDLDAVVFVLRNADRAVWQRQYLLKLLEILQENVPVVLLASCGPYDLVGEDEETLRKRTA